MIYLDPKNIYYRSFVFTEKNQPEWQQEIPHWRSYIQHFFHSNGLQLTDEQERVDEWINSPERAAFSDMILALLPEVKPVISPERIKSILMAHWTPDLHMGTSVVNAAIHALDLADCLALAISDRGPDAALFAMDGLNDCLDNKDEDGLLLIAEQKNLLYYSPLLDALKPENNACICLVNTRRQGLEYRGYTKRVQDKLSSDLVNEVIHKACLNPVKTIVIGPASALEQIRGEFHLQPTESSLLCSAPFVSLSKNWQPEKNYLLVSSFAGEISFNAFSGGYGL